MENNSGKYLALQILGSLTRSVGTLLNYRTQKRGHRRLKAAPNHRGDLPVRCHRMPHAGRLCERIGRALCPDVRRVRGPGADNPKEGRKRGGNAVSPRPGGAVSGSGGVAAGQSRRTCVACRSASLVRDTTALETPPEI